MPRAYRVGDRTKQCFPAPTFRGQLDKSKDRRLRAMLLRQIVVSGSFHRSGLVYPGMKGLVVRTERRQVHYPQRHLD